MYSGYKIVLSVQLLTDITNVIDVKLTFVLNLLNLFFFKDTIVLLTSKQYYKISYSNNTKAVQKWQKLDIDIIF